MTNLKITDRAVAALNDAMRDNKPFLPPAARIIVADELRRLSDDWSTPVNRENLSRRAAELDAAGECCGCWKQ